MIPYQNLDNLEAIQVIDGFVSKEYGLFGKQNYSNHNAPGLPKIFRTGMKPNEGISHIGGRSYSCGGSSKQFSKALWSGLGEPLERYCWSFSLPGFHKGKSYLDLKSIGEPVLSPTNFELYENWQYKDKDFQLVQHTEKHPFGSWVKAQRLLSDDFIWIPQTTSTTKTTTNGCACHSDRSLAILSALMELIERDCFFLAWWSMAKLPSIDESLPKVKEIKETLKFICKEVRIACVTNEIGLPVVIFQTFAENPALIITSSCKLNVDSALERTYTELLQSYPFVKPPLLNKKDLLSLSKNVQTLEDRIKLYGHKSFAQKTDFLIDPRTKRTPKDFLNKIPPENINYKEVLSLVLERFKKAGFSPLIVDRTTREVAKQGYHVVHAIVPGMIPLNASSKYRPLGCKRLWHGRKILNALNSSEPIKTLNPLPHPFP